MDNLTLFIAHTLIGFYFAFFGVWNIYHWRPLMEAMVQKNIPHPWLFLSIGIIWQILAGIMIIMNIYAKLAALSLIPFTIIAVCIFHPFWRFSGEHRALNFTIFTVNMTITLAALLLIIKEVIL